MRKAASSFRQTGAVALAICAGAVAGVFMAGVIGAVGNGPPSLNAGRADIAKRVAVSYRRHPVSVAPHGELAEVVPEDELRKLLVDLVPTWTAFKVAKALHAWRLWGHEANFTGTIVVQEFSIPILSGDQLTSILLDAREYRRWAPSDAPILLPTESGVSVRTYEVKGRTSFGGRLVHPDDLLVACGEVGLPADFTIRTEDGAEHTIADMLRDSISRLSTDQELEWTVEALARYLAPQSTWTNRFGESFSIDDAVAVLASRPLGEGACFGIHVPYALTCLLVIDKSENHELLNASSRVSITRYLQHVTQRLLAQQHSDGSWSRDWPGDREHRRGELRTPWYDKITATGDHLEWIALAPADVRPPNERIAKAVSASLVTVQGLSQWEISGYYNTLSHLARALCLLRAEDPMVILYGARYGEEALVRMEPSK